MEMERQNKKMQVWNLLAEKIRKLVEESVSNPEELQEIRIRTGQPLLIQMKGQERVLPDPAHPYLVTKEDIGETMGYICHYSLYAYSMAWISSLVPISSTAITRGAIERINMIIPSAFGQQSKISVLVPR